MEMPTKGIGNIISGRDQFVHRRGFSSLFYVVFVDSNRVIDCIFLVAFLLQSSICADTYIHIPKRTYVVCGFLVWSMFVQLIGSYRRWFFLWYILLLYLFINESNRTFDEAIQVEIIVITFMFVGKRNKSYIEVFEMIRFYFVLSFAFN